MLNIYDIFIVYTNSRGKYMRALLIDGQQYNKLISYANALGISVVAKTTLSNIYDDVLYYSPDLILYAKPITWEKIYELKSKYPFRFVFYSPDLDGFLDTKYLPIYTDLCKMLLTLKNDYKLSWPKIIKYLNIIGVKPLPPMRGNQFNHRNIERILKNCRGREN